MYNHKPDESGKSVNQLSYITAKLGDGYIFEITYGIYYSFGEDELAYPY